MRLFAVSPTRPFAVSLPRLLVLLVLLGLVFICLATLLESDLVELGLFGGRLSDSLKESTHEHIR
jgi:hypothetical protein